ncbi:MAG: hypothetical protein FWF24_03235, partial [Alphaproteobacteria bacterium]|nr:hypothetical protein [Alphaproteobacteria bacterium]
TLGGFTGQLLAVCNPSCTGMYRNGVAVGMSANFSAGDTIAIELTSASIASTPTTASVTVGTTTSATWTVTTNPNACVGTPSIGTLCDDGTVYAGLSSDGSVPMYTTPCDAGRVWNGTACTGVALQLTWDDGMGNSVATGFTSVFTGKANTAGLAALGTAPSPAPYRAALYCHNLTAHGYSDWYLPSSNELITLRAIGSYVSPYSVTSGSMWSSTETSSSTVQVWTGVGGQPENKNKTNAFRCVRR